MSYRGKSNKNKGVMRVGIVILGVVVIILLGNVFNWWAPLFPASEAETSTFEVRSAVDGEDVSSWTELSIWTQDPDADFDTAEDYQTLSNFEETVKSKHAEDISIDLSGEDVYYIEVQTSSSVWSNHFIRQIGGGNRHVIIDAYDLSSDVNFNIVDITTMGAISAGSLIGNYTAIMGVPNYNTANSHSGSNWENTVTEVADMTTAELEELYNEANYQLQAPLYNPSLDSSKAYDEQLEKITDAFTIRLTFNDSISKVDGVATQVNITLTDSNDPIEVSISGEYVYFIFFETLQFDAGFQEFDFSVDTAVNITYTTAQSGRVLTPYDDDNLGTFTALSTIGA